MAIDIIGQVWEVWNYNLAKDKRPHFGEGMCITNLPAMESLIVLMIGDGHSTIDELRVNAVVSVNQLGQQVGVLSSTLSNHINKQNAHNASAAPAAGRIAMYDIGGRLKTGEPVTATDTIRKQDLDALAVQIAEGKQDKKPDGTHAVIGSDGKVNPVYLPDAILGAMVYGGVFDSNGVITASAHAPELQGSAIAGITTAQYAGYYFISQGSRAFGGNDYTPGDWAVCQGNHTPPWMKVASSSNVEYVLERIQEVKDEIEMMFPTGYTTLDGDRIRTQGGKPYVITG
jgi:hypothetical protein